MVEASGEERAMGKRKSREVGEILVCWVATTHREEPLLTVLADHGSELRGAVELLVIGYRVAPGDAMAREAFEATREALLRELPPKLCPEIRGWPWVTEAAPIDHAPILDAAKALLTELRAEHPDARINIHLSPGTPAMHAAWLVLGHGGFIANTRMLQTRPERVRQPGDAPIAWVDLPAESWGRIVRSSAPTLVPADDDEVLWDPARVVSPSARRTLAQVQRWAPLPAPILLLGERGTGKTTLAHTIRAASGFRKLDRAAWPVVVCGQFRANPQLARADLFGHAKGSFTGASVKREGLLAEVEGDTLFLDEVADLDRTTQRLLMAALEGRGYQRIGEAKNRATEFRLLAATNRPLAALVSSARDGEYTLDADFFDRISTFVLSIPPLRERREDLPLLWASSLARAARSIGVGAALTGPIERAEPLLVGLRDHPLPGNLRDLQRAAWAAVAELHAGA
ncbi:MAG: sigma-54-dependent Fis family transcriptional regulator, partial [Deltaproteobacteria bacterium]